MNLLDVNQEVPFQYKGRTVSFTRHDPNGFWQVNMPHRPKELDGVYTGIEQCQQAYVGYIDKVEFLEATRKPTVAEAHFEKLMAEPELKPRKPKKVKTLSDGATS